MAVLDIAALGVLILLACLIVYLLWYLGGLPGRVAKDRQHPYQQAIAVGGWATLFIGGVTWPLVLMWAYASPASRSTASPSPGDNSDTDNNAGGNEELRKELQRLQVQVQDLTEQIQTDRETKQ